MRGVNNNWGSYFSLFSRFNNFLEKSCHRFNNAAGKKRSYFGKKTGSGGNLHDSAPIPGGTTVLAPDFKVISRIGSQLINGISLDTFPG